MVASSNHASSWIDKPSDVQTPPATRSTAFCYVRGFLPLDCELKIRIFVCSIQQIFTSYSAKSSVIPVASV
jgi:hypothetical protein